MLLLLFYACLFYWNKALLKYYRQIAHQPDEVILFGYHDCVANHLWLFLRNASHFQSSGREFYLELLPS